MAVNVEVKSKGNESAINLIRRFTRKVNNAGVLSKARSLRYRTRKPSEKIKQKQALRSLKRREEVERLIKLGKLPDRRIRAVEISKDKEQEKGAAE